MLTESAIESLATAIFDRPNPWVAEAFSAYDQDPLVFSSTDELSRYFKEILATPKGHAFVFVLYPDMNGRAAREVIRLTPGSVPGHTKRYTWQGWGLIAVQLYRDGNIRSRITANSQARAEKWASTYPEWEQPGTWNWRLVGSHARRLRRVLSKIAPVGERAGD